MLNGRPDAEYFSNLHFLHQIFKILTRKQCLHLKKPIKQLIVILVAIVPELFPFKTAAGI